MEATRSPCRIISVAIALALTIGSAAGLTSRQLSYDRSKRVGEVGAEDEIGEADLLPSALDFLGGGRRIIRKDWKASPPLEAQQGRCRAAS